MSNELRVGRSVRCAQIEGFRKLGRRLLRLPNPSIRDAGRGHSSGFDIVAADLPHQRKNNDSPLHTPSS
jgi:hypothetical protein